MFAKHDLIAQLLSELGLSTASRALRLRLACADGIRDDLLMPQRIVGSEAICEGIEYRVLCISADARIPLKSLIGLAAEVQIVTDRGQLHGICGIVTEVSAGQSDGGLATYQLVLRDMLGLMDLDTNMRVFLDKNELDIIEIILGEWRRRDSLLASSFEYTFSIELREHAHPRREFTMQYNETDAAFIRRLLKRRGIAWYIRSGRPPVKPEDDDGTQYAPLHTLVMFDDPNLLKKNAAGTVRFHRAASTEERDTIIAWGATRTLRPGSASGFSWDPSDPIATSFMRSEARSKANQGVRGNRIASSMDDYRVETTNIGIDNEDHGKMARARMARHEYETKHFHGESTVRDLRVGEWNRVDGHAELDSHPDEEREFVITSLQLAARNNLSKDGDARVDRLFAANRWAMGPGQNTEYSNTFTCIRRGIRIVPAFDPRTDVPSPQMHNAVVVGPPGEEVHCDCHGRVKVRFPGTRAADHEHAQGAGATDTDADSAYVRVGTSWAGNRPGSQRQFGTHTLPRVGTNVLIAYENGDPDRPVIIDQMFNHYASPPAMSNLGELPGNRFQSGMRSREIGGKRGNQLRFDDTPGQISAQLASEHGHSELNLGWCTEPRVNGKGAPRGEGAELRSDEYVALRGAKGLLLSAWKRVEGIGGSVAKQLARDEYIELMRECSELFTALGDYAAKHEALPTDGKAQEELKTSFRQWENGSNTEPDAPEGGEPVIGITAPAGISFATSKAIVSYAASNIDSVAQQHLQMTAGQRLSVNAGKGISLFAHHDGLKAIAHHGKLLLQSQHDDSEINSAKNIRLTATEGKVTAMAKVIELIAEDGSFIKIGDGSITFGSNSPLKFHGPDFLFDEPTTMASSFPTHDSGANQLRFVAKYYPHIDGGISAANLVHKIVVSDGTSTEGKSAADGMTDLLKSDAMHLATISLLQDTSDN